MKFVIYNTVDSANSENYKFLSKNWTLEVNTHYKLLSFSMLKIKKMSQKILRMRSIAWATNKYNSGKIELICCSWKRDHFAKILFLRMKFKILSPAFCEISYFLLTSATDALVSVKLENSTLKT